MKRDELRGHVEVMQKGVEERLKQMNQLKEDIEKKTKERSLNQFNLKRKVDGDHLLDGEIVHEKNKMVKLENQIRGYQIEAQKLNKTINLLEKEQEKYGIAATEAHANYYKTIEEVKIKNNLIAELQKKNAEIESKLKYQQNLYEAVRSDRNLYSKNLMESQQEISELTKKHTRMTHMVDQLKEEIKAKDAELLKQDFESRKIEEENKKTKQEKNRIRLNITSTEEVLKSKESHIAKLKAIITKTISEKQRHQKDLEMVLNERDILGTQLIKKNQELTTLYEKIKLSQSALTKGENFYRQKQEEAKGLRVQLSNLRKENNNITNQIACISSLKKEISSLEKDLLNQRTRTKALQDELSIQMNVHRWRKLEITDKDRYESILKIQTLQKRLISKTEEVEEKENLIKEKEKLFLELKNILARQPGPEIHTQLDTYRNSLKEKGGQMKNMLAELKGTRDNISVQKYAIQVLRSDLTELKNTFFKRRFGEEKVREINENPQNGDNLPELHEDINVFVQVKI